MSQAETDRIVEVEVEQADGKKITITAEPDPVLSSMIESAHGAPISELVIATASGGLISNVAGGVVKQLYKIAEGDMLTTKTTMRRTAQWKGSVRTEPFRKGSVLA